MIINLKLVNRTKVNGVTMASIMAVVSFGASETRLGVKKYKPINVYLSGCRIHESDWNSLLKRVCGKDNKLINSTIQKATDRLKWVSEYLLSENRLNKDELNNFLNQDEEWCKIFHKNVKIFNNGISIIEYAKQWIERLDFDFNLTSHVGRHTFCTQKIEDGFADSDVMMQTGHKSIQIFKNVYCHPDEKKLGETLKKKMLG